MEPTRRLLWCTLPLLIAACSRSTPPPPEPDLPRAQPADPWLEERMQMIEQQLVRRGITDERVLAAMRTVPRHQLVPERLRSHAYSDRPLPIGEEQTISQPYIVAWMSSAAELSGDERVLEVGTGSGYQAAVLGELAREVYSIEILPTLAERAARDLKRLGYEHIAVRQGDGYQGWPEHAPYDAILVTAAPDHIPAPLVEQLAPGGRLIIPVGRDTQQLRVLERSADGTTIERDLLPVRFVPMTGEAQQPRPE